MFVLVNECRVQLNCPDIKHVLYEIVMTYCGTEGCLKSFPRHRIQSKSFFNEVKVVEDEFEIFNARQNSRRREKRRCTLPSCPGNGFNVRVIIIVL